MATYTVSAKVAKPQTVRQKLDSAFGPELDRQAYEWLEMAHPVIVAIIERFVFDPDITPENIKSYLSYEVSDNRDAFVKACAGTLRHKRREVE